MKRITDMANNWRVSGFNYLLVPFVDISCVNWKRGLWRERDQSALQIGSAAYNQTEPRKCSDTSGARWNGRDHSTVICWWETSWCFCTASAARLWWVAGEWRDLLRNWRGCLHNCETGPPFCAAADLASLCRANDNNDDIWQHPLKPLNIHWSISMYNPIDSWYHPRSGCEPEIRQSFRENGTKHGKKNRSRPSSTRRLH